MAEIAELVFQMSEIPESVCPKSTTSDSENSCSWFESNVHSVQFKQLQGKTMEVETLYQGKIVRLRKQLQCEGFEVST